MPQLPGEETGPREVQVLAQGHTAREARAGPRPGDQASPPTAPPTPTLWLISKTHIPEAAACPPCRPACSLASVSLGLPWAGVPSPLTPLLPDGHHTTASHILEESLGQGSTCNRENGRQPAAGSEGAPGLGSAGHGWAGCALCSLPAIGPGPHGRPLCGGQEASPRGGRCRLGGRQGAPRTIPGLRGSERPSDPPESHRLLLGRQVHLPPHLPCWFQKGRRGPLQWAGGGAIINPESCELGWINIYRAFLALPTAVQG